MANLELVLRGGPRDGERIELDQTDTYVFGRDIECDVQILDSRLSRAHFRIERQNGGEVKVWDLDSTNGTFVNGSRICDALLVVGDVIKVGESEVQLVDVDRASVEITVIEDTSPFGPTTICQRYEADGDGVLDCISTEAEPEPDYQRLYAHLRTLISISGIMNTDMPLSDLMQHVIDTVTRIFQADRGCLVLQHRNREPERYFSCPGGFEPTSDIWRLSSTILSRALHDGMSLRSTDAGEDERFRDGKSILLESIKSVMCVPVETGEGILGAIYLDTLGGIRPYTEADLEMLSAVGKQTGMALRREIAKEEKDLLFLDTIHAVIASIEAKDPATAGHSARVAEYAEQLAYKLEYNRVFVDRLNYAAHLHDVGKIGISEQILNKPGPLDREELEIVRTHPVIGARILENIRNIEDVILRVRHHHERLDGKGYPDGLAGEDIPLMSRIIAVVDALDAITSNRSYREGMSIQFAIEEFERCSGAQFDPRFASKLVEMLKSGEMTVIQKTLKVF